MQEDVRNCSCDCNNNNNSCGFLGNLFNRNGCGCGDNSILFFILIFLLLFTNCGCCNR